MKIATDHYLNSVIYSRVDTLLDLKTLEKCLSEGMDSLINYLVKTPYFSAVRLAPTDFENPVTLESKVIERMFMEYRNICSIAGERIKRCLEYFAMRYFVKNLFFLISCKILNLGISDAKKMFLCIEPRWSIMLEKMYGLDIERYPELFDGWLSSSLRRAIQTYREEGNLGVIEAELTKGVYESEVEFFAVNHYRGREAFVKALRTEIDLVNISSIVKGIALNAGERAIIFNLIEGGTIDMKLLVELSRMKRIKEVIHHLEGSGYEELLEMGDTEPKIYTARLEARMMITLYKLYRDILYDVGNTMIPLAYLYLRWIESKIVRGIYNSLRHGYPYDFAAELTLPAVSRRI
ncbi:hypothetical protein B6U74_03000 [Candidatus Bathyarchaeota archaeon ex4484_205]|nr:MAG: hypothetical protein B6U74_03000 [Candidatus Bathyarchaeota archaeon ex4484_205]